MGQEGLKVNGGLARANVTPEPDEVEVSLFGPGYGESALIHIGNGKWVIVDSFLDEESEPIALAYLRDLGFDPAEAVLFIVATHWHDDHIRGMAKLVEFCAGATFCCAAALRTHEFLAAVGALESKPSSVAGSGVQELYEVFSLLTNRSSRPVFAMSSRRIFNYGGCQIWSLSPFDKEFAGFLQEVGNLVPNPLEAMRRIPPLTPNKLAIVLWVKVGETVLLLGSDLERPGWLDILEDGERPRPKASVFKIPHHGSENAHEDRVWNEMLHSEPIAALAPWRRGGRELPKNRDTERINSFTPMAYATTTRLTRAPRERARSVERTIRETGVKIRRIGHSPGVVRLRKKLDSPTAWDIDLFGSACHLTNYRG